MRIERLDLERYGHFEGTSLDLSSGAGVRLHIVHGRNEAGKSTALSAICDLLFGVPHNSAMGFRHSNTALRIGALLALADGTRLEVKRRKGTKATLLDGDGSTALPDNLLTPHLCGLDRAGFQRLFGLDHERLRAGGQAMLEAGGDLARTLFQAGSGLSGLDRITASLSDDADAIGSPHRKQGSKPLWQAADAYAEAAARMRNDATRAEAWEAAEAAVEAARVRVGDIRTDLATAERDRSRLERLRRVRPLLAALDDLAGQLAAAGDGPDLPDHLAADWRRAEALVMTSTRQAEQAEAARAEAEAALTEAGPVPALLSLASAIEALYQRQGEVAKAAHDLPRREQDRTATLARLEQAAREIGLTAGLLHLETLLPRRPVTAAIRQKAKEQARLEQAQADARRRHEAALRELRQAERHLPHQPPDAARLGEADAALNAARRSGEIELRLDRALRAVADGKTRLDQLTARLGRFSQPPERLATLPLPVMAAVEQQRQQEQALENRRQRLADERRNLEEQAARLRQALRDLTGPGDVPTPSAIAEARADRDQRWALLRPHLTEPTPAPAGAIAAFDGALRGADDLADRRDQQSQRVADFLRTSSELVTLDERLVAAGRDAERVEREGDQLAAAWIALWQPAGITPGAPAEMAAFLTQAGAILTALDQQAQLAEAAASLSKEADHCADLLSRALVLCDGPTADDSPLPALRAMAEAAMAQARLRLDQATKAEQAVTRARQTLEQAEDDLNSAEAALSGWGTGWAGDMAAIGLSPHALPAEAEAALTLWEDIGNDLRALGDLDHRIDALSRDIASHRRDSAALLVAATDLMPGLDVAAEQAAEALFAALGAARGQAARRDALTQAHDRAVEMAARAEQAARAAIAACSDLRRLHRLLDSDDVPALTDAAARRRDLRAQETALLAELHRAGDGQDPDSLRAALSGLDPDGMTAEVAILSARIGTAQNDLAEASVKQREAERTLDEMRQRAGIGGAAQDAADAAARTATLAGRWLRLRAASLLLTQAVEHYRSRNEHPLLRRAGAILATMAANGGNPVLRLKIDYGAGDNPVLVGVRQDGSDAHVEGMSEGLRDQLFLALRIASVEAHVAQASPLPFIADDLFITSDEARTRAGLLALAELGQAAQVVLFTHHEYVVDAGVEALGTQVRVHRLSAG